MTTDTVLTDEDIVRLAYERDAQPEITLMRLFARAIEQAVLQSEQVQGWRRDAERLEWLETTAHCADWVKDEPTKRVIRAHDGAEFEGETWSEAVDHAILEEQP